MTINKEHELKMVFIANNPYDFKGFCEYCKSHNIPAIPYVTFAAAAQEFLPEDERMPVTAVQRTSNANCGGCGGGKVR